MTKNDLILDVESFKIRKKSISQLNLSVDIDQDCQFQFCFGGDINDSAIVIAKCLVPLVRMV